MADEQGWVYEFGPYRFDPQERVLTRDGKRIALQPKQSDLLSCLLKHAGRILEKQFILDEVWPATHVTEGALTVAMHGLRAKLGDPTDGPLYVETIPWRGYRFTAPVSCVPAGSGPRLEPVTQPASDGQVGVLSPAGTPVVIPTAVATARRAFPFLRSRTLSRFAGVAVGLTIVTAGILVLRARPASPIPRVLRITQLTDDRRPKNGRMFTDGSRLYFQQGVTEGLALVSMPVDGRETTPVSTPFRFSMTDVNPVRRELLGVRITGNAFDTIERELFALPVGGGPPRRVGDIKAWEAVFSPDGEWIAFVRKQDLYVVRSDGREPHKLTTIPGQAESIRWSPDGETLRFCVSARDPAQNGASVRAIWEVATDGTNLHRLLTDKSGMQGGCFCTGWTADGKYFIFATYANGRSDIWALDERRTLFRKSPREPLLLNADPLSWYPMTSSPNGKRFYAIGSQLRLELVRYDLNLRAFVPYFGGRPATWAVSSPDRQWIAYMNLSDQTIWRARADGTEARQITFAPMKAGGHAWSPDGKWIAFRGWQPGREVWRIYVLPSEGGVAEPLLGPGLKPADMDEGIPAWSADGTRVAFGEVPAVFAHGTGKEVIHVYDRVKRRLSSLPGSEGLWTARWSPDGRFICALTIKEQKLMVFEVATGRWRPLNTGPVDNPTWSYDSRYVYFNTMEEGDHGLFRVSVPGGAVERLASLDDLPMLHGWSGVAPDNSPLMVRNRNVEEIYALDLMLP